MMKSNRAAFRALRGLGLATVVALATASLAACSSGGSAAPESGEEGATASLKVLMAPIGYEVAHIAANEGYFEDENLAVELLDGGTAQDNLAQLAGGSADLSTLSWDALVTATSQGVAVKGVAGGSVISDEIDTSGVFVRADSGIADIADLRGKTIAFNSLGTGGNVPVLQALAEEGITDADFTAVAIPYASMQAALENSQVDAVLAADSFFAQITANDAYAAIAHPVREFRAGLPITLWGADEAWLEQNGDVAERFVAALERAVAFYEDPANKDAILDIRAQVTGQPVDKVSTLMVPFSTAIDTEVAQSVTEALEEFGIVQNPKPADEILWSGAPRA